MPLLEVFPYQAEGANWIARRERCGLLDEMRIGKTATIVRACDLRRAKRGVIIAPADLREHWRGEFEKFGCMPRKIVKGRTLHDFVAWSRGVFDVLVTSYEMAVKWRRHFDEHGELFDFLAMDEAHYLKNLDSQRTRAVLGECADGIGGIAQWACQGWFVTGTLNDNDPSDCYPFLQYTRAVNMSYEQFCRTFFTSRNSAFGKRNKPRPEMVATLRQLIQNNSIRRTEKDIGRELPPMFVTTQLVDGDTDQVRHLLAGHPGLDDQILAAIREGGLSFLDSQYIATLRRLLAEAKAVPYAHLLAAELKQTDQKYIVFGISRQALITVRDVLAKCGYDMGLIVGGVNEKEREDYKRRLGSDSSFRGIVCNMDAAGVGNDFADASRLDVLESWWGPGKNAQAIKRIRGPRQKNKQFVRFITLARSFDEQVNLIVAEKTRNIAMVEGSAMITGPEVA